jgi:hypothetical protein
MRRWTSSLGAGVLVVAFLIVTRSAVAEAPNAGTSLTPIESASSGSLFGRLTAPLGAASSSAQTPIQTVAIPPHKSVSFPHTSMFRPKAPNIHTRPKKKSTSWWPFGKK